LVRPRIYPRFLLHLFGLRLVHTRWIHTHLCLYVDFTVRLVYTLLVEHAYLWFGFTYGCSSYTLVGLVCPFWLVWFLVWFIWLFCAFTHYTRLHTVPFTLFGSHTVWFGWFTMFTLVYVHTLRLILRGYGWVALPHVALPAVSRFIGSSYTRHTFTHLARLHAHTTRATHALGLHCVGFCLYTHCPHTFGCISFTHALHPHTIYTFTHTHPHTHTLYHTHTVPLAPFTHRFALLCSLVVPTHYTHICTWFICVGCHIYIHIALWFVTYTLHGILRYIYYALHGDTVRL